MISALIFSTASDRRIKNDLGAISPKVGLQEILALPDPHRFTFKNGYGPAGVHTGEFAQDVPKELTLRGPASALTPDGVLQYNQVEQVAYLIAAVKAMASCKLSVMGHCWIK